MDKDIRVSDVGTAEQYRWGAECEGWHLLKHEGLSVIQERVPAGASEVEHFHAVARQFFYVLSGEGCMETAGQAIRIRAGQGLHVEPGVRHRFVNRSATDVVFLVISSPTTSGDRINTGAAG